MTDRVRISDLRRVARRSPGDPLGFVCLWLVDSAESMQRLHDEECGCEAPGSPVCGWEPEVAGVLALFDFDEEVERR